ncbi:CU044_2847 family protein [Kitasatospora sp. NPDC097691]|uniref:CU044_2847 family protein n=1 Tax=Kitasatospora sp. NPDC097691 TaxID=3157231 RepID=UPI003317072E
MGETVELKLADGTGVVVELSPAPAAYPVELPPGAADLPPGSAPVVPVGRARRAAEAAGRTLADVLSPLGGVLDSVHSAVRGAVRPPDEVEVELGVKLTHDLKLGIAGAGGEATITVRATWTPRSATTPAVPAAAPAAERTAQEAPATQEPASPATVPGPADPPCG